MTEATAAAMYVPTFFMRQKLTLMVNRYELAAAPDGREGEVLALRSGSAWRSRRR